MMRSTPLREFTSSRTAISSAVPFLKNPPMPTYSPSVFSRITIIRMSFSVRSRKGVSRSWSNSTGRAFTYRSSLKRRPSRISAACWLEGTRGSPSAPKRMASNSSRNISTAPAGSDTPSRKYLSAPQSNSTNSSARFPAAATARSTFTASGVTSFPIPSPGMTAIRAATPPFRKGLFPTKLFSQPPGRYVSTSRATLRFPSRLYPVHSAQHQCPANNLQRRPALPQPPDSQDHREHRQQISEGAQLRSLQVPQQPKVQKVRHGRAAHRHVQHRRPPLPWNRAPSGKRSQRPRLVQRRWQDDDGPREMIERRHR